MEKYFIVRFRVAIAMYKFISASGINNVRRAFYKFGFYKLFNWQYICMMYCSIIIGNKRGLFTDKNNINRCNIHTSKKFNLFLWENLIIIIGRRQKYDPIKLCGLLSMKWKTDKFTFLLLSTYMYKYYIISV